MWKGEKKHEKKHENYLYTVYDFKISEEDLIKKVINIL